MRIGRGPSCSLWPPPAPAVHLVSPLWELPPRPPENNAGLIIDLKTTLPGKFLQCMSQTHLSRQHRFDPQIVRIQFLCIHYSSGQAG